MIIISLSGKKGVGKNTVAKLIAELTPLWCCEVAYADALKGEVAIATGRTIDYINAHKEHFRLILQGWGTDFRRQLDGDMYWINKLDNKIVEIYNEKKVQVLIITDARFPNEVRYGIEVGAICINVVRSSDQSDKHSSETANDNVVFDYTISNNGTVDELQEQIKTLMQKLSIKIKL